MNLGTAEVIRANARHLPLADNTVDLVVTSPPYFALRSYQDGGEHYDGQIGSEPTPAEFVDALLEVTRECVRVLKPSGSLWVNLGDKYSTGSGGDSNLTALGQKLGSGGGQKQDSAKVRSSPAAGFRPKTLLGIPWRYALACIDDLGLILRAEVIWSKPNGLPESVTDRVRRSHEQWFHFTLQPRYFSAVDEIREAYSDLTVRTYPTRSGDPNTTNHGTGNSSLRLADNPLGKLPGSVWVVPTEPLRVPDHLGIDHFAAFPTEWPKRIIAGWSPAGVCVACGEGRRPVVDKRTEVAYVQNNNRPARMDLAESANGRGYNAASYPHGVTSATITGYTCACPHPTADTTPAVVLDPFGGTGTTALAAKALGRHGISVDMSADYCRLAEWRTNDRNQLAKVLGVAKAEQQDDGQAGLFDMDEPPPKVRGNAGSSLVGLARWKCVGCGGEPQNARAATCEKCGTPRGEGPETVPARLRKGDGWATDFGSDVGFRDERKGDMRDIIDPLDGGAA